MLERDFQKNLIAFAKALGYMVHHDKPAMNSKGDWLTHGAGHPGFPDLVLLHPHTGVLIIAELKSTKGKLRTSQENWLQAFNLAGIANYVWRPQDLIQAKRVLEHGARQRWDYNYN